jgi:methylase of polypeptide subunit release factors
LNASKTTEWEIVSLAAGWMNNLFEAHGSASPFKQARVEATADGSQKRRDITIIGQDGNPAVTGEAKMPWAADGHSPFVEAVVRDARDKAARAGVNFFFTWNLSQLVLWRRDVGGQGLRDFGYVLYDIADIHREAQKLDPRQERKIRDGIERFTLKLMEQFKADVRLPLTSEDDYFVLALESFLKRPVEEARHGLRERDSNDVQRQRLDHWARSQQGWTISEDRDDLIDRAAKFASYATVNKIVFYEALRKRFGKLPDIVLPPEVRTADEAINALGAFFSRARKDSRDYETVFGFDPSDYGIQIPFLTEAAIEGWRGVLEHVEKFDFTRLDYDVIGRIFEKLISPEERHKFGQYYTRPELVDLINAFCIKSASDRVMDPGCGGGTFLVRAYARRKFLDPDTSHETLLSNTFGIDVSHFAAHLTTINLASRELVESENYPRVARSDFFDTAPDTGLVSIPSKTGAVTLVAPGKFDAIIANPPYVRQEDIGKSLKDRYAAQVKSESKLAAGGRSDLHVYFWGHALTFLKDNGRLGFLTSSQWLDVEYGFPLQKWILENFRIVAIIESEAEPWFEGARVATTATILERESDPEKRNSNVVRFVQIRKKLIDLVGSSDSRDMLVGAERIARQISNTDEDGASPDWRIRLRQQSELLAEGIQLGVRRTGRSAYAGGKWGIPLRAPDVWFNLLRDSNSSWIPLAEIAKTARGITSGKDDFFYLEDTSTEGLSRYSDPSEFEKHFGAPRDKVASRLLTLAKVGTGEVFPIEAEYLKPYIHSIMDVDAYMVSQVHARGVALMLPSSAKLDGQFIEKYVLWGEAQKYQTKSTCASRERKDGRRWYDLTDNVISPIFWSKSHQYRHIAPLNRHGFLANCNLYTVELETQQAEIAFGVLNSSLVVLSKFLFGRPVGVEGNFKTEVVDVEMMLVPDWTKASKALAKRISAAAKRLELRPVLGFLSARRLRQKSALAKTKNGIADLSAFSDQSELEQADRHELDDAVLELLGYEDPNQRKALRAEIYDYLRHRFERERQKEEAAIDNKARSKKRQRVTADGLAAAVFKFVSDRQPALLRGYDSFLHLMEQAGIAMEGRPIPDGEEFEIIHDLASTGLRYKDCKSRKWKIEKARHPEQAGLMLEIALAGEGPDIVFMPSKAADAAKLAFQFREHRHSREQAVRDLIDERTSDPDMAEKAFGIIHAMIAKAER